MTLIKPKQYFREKLDELKERAREVGLNMTLICKGTKISRATPDRWEKQFPLTIERLEQMEEFVEKREAEVANSIPGELR